MAGALGKRTYRQMGGSAVARFPVRKRRRTGLTYAPVIPGLTRRSGGYARAMAARAIGVEMKYYDRLQADVTAPTDGHVILSSLNNIVQGDGPSARDGRVLHIKSIFIHGLMYLASGGAPPNNASDTFRVVVYQDMQTNGTAALSSDVFTIPATRGYLAFRNLDNTGRFKILADKMYRLESGTVGTVNGADVVQKQFKINLPNLDIKVTNNLTTNSITGIRDNNVGIIIFSQTGDGKVTVNTRTRFIG